MIKQVKSLKELEKDAIEIQMYLEVTVSDNPEEIVERGNNLSVWMARTTKMLADAKFHQSIAKRKAYKANQGKGYSPSVIKDIVNNSTTYENYLVDIIDKQNRTCTHQLDWCRTIVSKNKAEMLQINR